jgi:hypothetical protein
MPYVYRQYIYILLNMQRQKKKVKCLIQISSHVFVHYLFLLERYQIACLFPFCANHRDDIMKIIWQDCIAFQWYPGQER